MLERFSSAARAAVTHARTEAQGLQHGGIGAEHLLLGVLHEDAEPAVRLLLDAGFELPAARTAVREAERGFGRADAAALESIGIDLAAVLEKVEEGFGPGALSRRRGRSGGMDSRRLRFDNGAR
jgi:ATP-dependent Clp protease ATP-binding subunit ClpA